MICRQCYLKLQLLWDVRSFRHVITKIHKNGTGSSTQVSLCGGVLLSGPTKVTHAFDCVEREISPVTENSVAAYFSCWNARWLEWRYSFMVAYMSSLITTSQGCQWILILTSPLPHWGVPILWAGHRGAGYSHMRAHPIITVPVVTQEWTQTSWYSQGCMWIRPSSPV